MKTRVQNTASPNVDMQQNTYNQRRPHFIMSETIAEATNDSSSNESYSSNSVSINIKTELAVVADECIPDDGIDLYEEQTVESSYSVMTDYNILKDLVNQSVKNEGELIIHSNFVDTEQEITAEQIHSGWNVGEKIPRKNNVIKLEYDEVDPNEYEVVADQINTMAYEEHGDIVTQEEVQELITFFPCNKCPLNFESDTALQNHKKIHNDKPFRCQICSRTFNKEMGMKVHITLKHRKPELNNMLKIKIKEEDNKPTIGKRRGRKKLNEQQFECKDCHRHFTELTHLKNHLKFHNQWKSKPFECEICFKCFGQQGNLDTHKKIHLGHKQFKCHLCTRDFFQKGNLTTHLKIHSQNNNYFKQKVKKPKKEILTINNPPPPPLNIIITQSNNVKKFSCELCSKSFVQYTNLQTHMRMHTGDRPFKCSYCIKSFTQLGNLQKHLKIHTGERPFKCEVCAKAFVQKCQMQKHLHTHTGERPNKCGICSKSFVQKNHLQKHMSVHNGYSTIKKEKKLSMTKLKVFPCKYCSKMYKQNYNLNKHMVKCIGNNTNHITRQSNSKQIHFEKITKVNPEESAYQTDSSDENASVGGNASTDSSNDSSVFGNSDYD